MFLNYRFIFYLVSFSQVMSATRNLHIQVGIQDVYFPPDLLNRDTSVVWLVYGEMWRQAPIFLYLSNVRSQKD